MSRRVLRYEVPVDDQWHRVDLDVHDYIVHVASRRADTVEFWATEPVDIRRTDTGGGEFVAINYTATAPSRGAYEYRVFGTGHEVEDGIYVGSAITAGGALVWHLFRREVQP